MDQPVLLQLLAPRCRWRLMHLGVAEIMAFSVVGTLPRGDRDMCSLNGHPANGCGSHQMRLQRPKVKGRMREEEMQSKEKTKQKEKERTKEKASRETKQVSQATELPKPRPHPEAEVMRRARQAVLHSQASASVVEDQDTELQIVR